MKQRIGILTSGGDCPGLNATIRGVTKAVYERMGTDAEIIGIIDGYSGLINGEYHIMQSKDFSGILTQGGTILGTSRQPFKTINVVGEDKIDKVAAMKANYKKLKLDCLLTLGGNGTHKTANLLSEQGLNIIGLPKTIDNDIWDTDKTFGFHTAVETGTEVIDRLQTTAASHSRVIVVEIMGNKAGWLTLYSGIAGGADIIILPEIPFDLEKIAESITNNKNSKRVYKIIAVAEGAMDVHEAKMKKKDRLQKRIDEREITATSRIARGIEKLTNIETRTVVPGHILRGGSPCAYDRVLATQFGVYAADLIKEQQYGVTVAYKSSMVTHNLLAEIAGKTKFVPHDHQLVRNARSIGIDFGD